MITQKELDRNVPRELKDLRRWVGWAPDPKTSKPKCPVIISAKERRASTRKPETWSSFKAASAFYAKYGDGRTIGVGYVFAQEDGLIYVDIDDAVDADGKLREWAQPFVEPFISRSYIELSPSGKGLHIIGKGTLPAGAGPGGKANFPQHATGAKVPEVAIFGYAKYTTITGNVWRGHVKLGDCTEAVATAWSAAGIHALGVEGTFGEAPKDEELLEPEAKKIPAAVKRELQECKTAVSEDRSGQRFKLYTEAAERLEPEELFALVVKSDWYDLSGAAEKGREHTWQDICRAYAKAQTAAKEFEAVKEEQREDNEARTVAWKELGISVITEMTKSGPVHRAVYGARNMALVMSRHPEWKGRIRLNLFKEQLELDGRIMQEHDIVHVAEAVRAYLGWEREPQLDLAWKAAVAAGNEVSYNPLQDALRAVEWDGKARISDWLVRVGCEDDELTRLIGRKWIISLVARALRPGCKVDTVLVLEGPQGRKKSSLFRMLAGGPEYFTDAHVTYDKDGQLIMHGHWIVELAELATFQKAEQPKTKQFIASPDLTFRAPYGRVTITRPRHFLLVGTTNDDEYLTDTSGNRRYWPIRTTGKQLDLAWLEKHREQLLAEAVHALEAGEPWWFDEEPQALEEAREARLQRDPLEDKVRQFIEQNPGAEFDMGTLLEGLGASPERRDLAQRVAATLRAAGFARAKRRVGGVPRWLWRDYTFDDGLGESDVTGGCVWPITAAKPRNQGGGNGPGNGSGTVSNAQED